MGEKRSSTGDQSDRPVTSVRSSSSSNDLGDGLSTVMNSKKKKRQSTLNGQLRSFHDAETSVQTETVPAVPLVAPVSNLLTSSPVQQSIPVPPVPVTNDSTRYALSRFPFPPFLIRFHLGNVLPSHIKEDLVNFCKETHQVDIQVLNCRLSRSANIAQEKDFLLYMKDSFSFSFLLEANHWPSLIKNQRFSLPSLPPIPPQLSLLVKNVDLNIDFDDFCSDIKSRYPSIKNVLRMKNKFQCDIRMVKIEFTSSVARDKLLSERKILINYIYYIVDEYLAPFQVLICSKCSGIGHFRNACTQVKSTCKTCCELIDNPNQHRCSNLIKCAHCGAAHRSTSSVCPIIKAYRAELTRKILQPVESAHPVQVLSSTNCNWDHSHPVSNAWFLPRQRDSPPSSNADMMIKLDDLIGKISEVKDHLASLSMKYEKFEKIIDEKQTN